MTTTTAADVRTRIDLFLSQCGLSQRGASGLRWNQSLREDDEARAALDRLLGEELTPARAVQIALVITCGAAMPVLSQASRSFAPSPPRNAFWPWFARSRNCTYSQLVGW